MPIRWARRALPVLRAGEVAIVGASLAGIAAALEFARTGRRVVIIEPRTYLGQEITARLRPWIPAGNGLSGRWIEGLVRAAGLTDGAFKSGEIPLHPDRIKLYLEDALLAVGVHLLYASLPVGVIRPGEALGGLIIGNKSGRQIVVCQTVVDATETALVAHLAGVPFEPHPSGPARFWRTLEFDQVLPLETAHLEVPQHLRIAGDVVTLCRGYHGAEHVFVECDLELPAEPGLAGTMRREIEARQRTMALAYYLVNDVPEFARARLAATSYELHGLHTPRMEQPDPDWTADVSEVHIPIALGQAEIVELPLRSFAAPLPGLWCLQEAVRLRESDRSVIRDPVAAPEVGAGFARALIGEWDRGWRAGTQAQAGTLVSPDGDSEEKLEQSPFGLTARPSTSLRAAQDVAALRSLRRYAPERKRGRWFPYTPYESGVEPHRDLEVLEPDSPQRGRPYPQRPVPAEEVPVLARADVLVVGGGTSGATAAIVAAREGVRTVLLELNPGLGGTATFGGVDSYWFGRRVGFAARMQQSVDEVHRRLRYPQPRLWNVEAKMYALLRDAEQAGVEIFFNVITIGAVVEDHRLRGAVVATRFGPLAVLADLVVDATGDGDVAAFAGAEHVYGSARDHVVMWYNLSQHAKPGRPRNSFTSMVDVSNVEDYTRAILAGRRRGENCHDHGIYVASRETRHIQGDVTLTLADLLLQRSWPDVVNLHFSNYDIKGKSGADWILLGLIPPNLEIEIPYRCLLPKGLDGILVAGKAISATHDALPAIRMQADMENLGGVAGLAAAMAVRAGTSPRQLDVPALQRRLVAEGLLPQAILTRSLRPRQFSDEELATLIDSLRADQPLHAYSDMRMNEVFRGIIPLVEICTLGRRAVLFLEQALDSASGERRILLAQLLAMCGSQAGVPTLIGRIQEILAREELPTRESFIRNSDLPPPDQGAMPDVVYLIYSLGMARDRRSLAVWEQVADLLDFSEEDLWDYYKAPFFYVDSVCYGAERLADSAAISILEKMHTHPYLHDQVCREGFQPNFIEERKAMLELAIGRALARCGSSSGYEILISYLEDNRALLAEQAHTELVAITEQDLRKDQKSWTEWLERSRGNLKPVPVLERLDMPDEDEEILRSADMAEPESGLSAHIEKVPWLGAGA